jgi:hypothetical protein
MPTAHTSRGLLVDVDELTLVHEPSGCMIATIAYAAMPVR